MGAWLAAWCLLAAAAPAADPPGLLLGRAEAAARAGDYAGARQLAEAALELPGDHQRAAQLLIAATQELTGDTWNALLAYEALASVYPRRDVPAALRLRLAVTHHEVGHAGAARRQLRRLDAAAERDPPLALQVAVLRGLWDLDAGRDARGLRALRDALASPAPSPWWRARAHDALAAYATTQILALPPARSPAELDAQLALEAELVATALDQITAIVRLSERATAERALVDLAAALDAIARRLETTPHLEPSTRLERAVGVRKKALGALQRALTVAEQRDADADALRALLALRDAEQARLEAIDP